MPKGKAGKRLSEVLSAAVITSDRFKKYYDHCPDRPPGDVDDILHEIACLILGYPISDQDLALPELISGPVDADKIDYMLRDARACGITLGIDVSRLFFRAGVYEVRQGGYLSQAVANGIRKFSLPLKLFIIDQSGTDAVQELGSARLSLYARVYHHQLTRNAESHFHAALAAALKSKDAALGFTKDLLEFWTAGDAAVLDRLSQTGDPTVSDLIQDLLMRRLLKRAATIGTELLSYSAPGWQDDAAIRLSEVLGGLRDNTARAILIDLGQREKRIALTISAAESCRQIRSHLLEAKVPLGKLPQDDRPSEIRFVPPAAAKDAVLPQALVLTPSRHVIHHTTREASYRDSSRIAQERAYLLVPPEWKEIGLLAFQMLLFRWYRNEQATDISIGVTSSTDSIAHPESPEYLTNWRPTFSVLYRPTLNLELTAAECRIRWKKLSEWQTHVEGLSAKLSPYRSAPVLVSARDLADKKKYDEFSSFIGEGGWRVKSSSDGAGAIEYYLSQFPPHLRTDALNMINSIKILDRPEFVQQLSIALEKLPDWSKVHWHLAPLTPSSGMIARTLLKDQANRLGGKRITLHATLQDAIAKTKDDDSVVLIDDHTASGTQAANQIKFWTQPGEARPAPNSNYFSTALEEPGVLKERRLFFAFAVGRDEGRRNLIKRCGEMGITLNAQNIVFGEDLQKWSGAIGSPGEISKDLRDFMRKVGMSIIAAHITKGAVPTPEKKQEIARKALGYDNFEGLFVTSYNVPTSTYTALWRPGTYTPADEPDDFRVPWRPLFIRQGMFRDVVIG